MIKERKEGNVDQTKDWFVERQSVSPALQLVQRKANERKKEKQHCTTTTEEEEDVMSVEQVEIWLYNYPILIGSDQQYQQ